MMKNQTITNAHLHQRTKTKFAKISKCYGMSVNRFSSLFTILLRSAGTGDSFRKRYK